MKLYSNLVNIILKRYINLYLEPGIEATACARELLYVYIIELYLKVNFPRAEGGL